MQAPRPPGRCVTSCLPPGLWEPGGHTCRPPGVEIGRPGAGTCVGRGGGPTCKASRGLAASSQPYPAPPPLFPVALRTSPRPSKPSTAHAWTSGSFVRSFHRRRWASGLPRRQAVLSVGPKPDLGAGATDQGLTGTWGDWRQGDPGVHTEAWWVPDTGAQLGSGCGQRREGLLPYSSRPRTCWGRLVREVEELEAATLG